MLGRRLAIYPHIVTVTETVQPIFLDFLAAHRDLRRRPYTDQSSMTEIVRSPADAALVCIAVIIDGALILGVRSRGVTLVHERVSSTMD